MYFAFSLHFHFVNFDLRWSIFCETFVAFLFQGNCSVSIALRRCEIIMETPPADMLLETLDLETDVKGSPGHSSGDEDGGNPSPSARRTAAKSKAKAKGSAAPSEAGSSGTKKPPVNRELAGVRKQNKLFSRRCRGCGLFFKPDAMASKSAFCLRDKHRLDCLARVAKSQGKSKWLAEVRKDEEKVMKVLKKYEEMTGGSGLLKAQGSKSTLFTSLESVSATSRVQFGTEMQMMPEDVYFKHATEKLSEGEGRLTKAQAQIQWQTWMSLIQETPDTDELIWDRKGANGSVRVAVPLRDTVLTANIYDRTKQLQCREKDVKDLSEEAILQKKKALLQDHDRHTEMDCKAIGAGMVKAAGDGLAGNSFSGNAYDIDVEMLNDSCADNEEDEPKEEGDEGKTENADPEPQKSPQEPVPKKRGYFDKDTQVASKVRAESNALVTLQMNVDTRLEEARAQLKEVSKRGPDCSKETLVEKETLVRRLEFLEAVIQPDSASLQRLQESVSALPAGAASSGSLESSPAKNDAASVTEGTSWTNQISKAPPCDLAGSFNFCMCVWE